MAELQGFWSYVHADDSVEGERIAGLARDVSAQYEMMTGETVSLFLDRDAIEWGERWRDKIDETLASVAFFIPVLTPRFFLSAECRREFQFFARQATRLGVKELVLPLHYVNVPALRDDSPSDDLIKLVRTFQWEDWRDLRFKERSSEEYRRGVAHLAERLVEANRAAEEASSDAAVETAPSTSGDVPDDTPGTLDNLAQAEEALPAWTESLQEIGQGIEVIGRLMSEATEEMNKNPGQGFKLKLAIARRLARDLQDPTERIWESGNEFASQMHDVDQGFRTIIERAPTEVGEDPSSKTEYCSFFGGIRSMSASAHEGLDQVQQMVETIAPIEKMSRDMRPALRKLRQGLTLVLEAREVIDEWVKLVDASGVDCEDSGPQPNGKSDYTE